MPPVPFKVFSDESIIEFDTGRFDDWCVYLRRPSQARFAPRDNWYFSELVRLGEIHGHASIYADFVQIYDHTAKKKNPKLLDGITRLTAKYNADALLIDILLSIIYAGMLAEENKANTRLGKRVKRLGMHQCLLEGVNPDIAANFSRGKTWREIAEDCVSRGF